MLYEKEELTISNKAVSEYGLSPVNAVLYGVAVTYAESGVGSIPLQVFMDWTGIESPNDAAFRLAILKNKGVFSRLFIYDEVRMLGSDYNPGARVDYVLSDGHAV